VATSRILDIMADSFFDGITGAALFGKLRRPGAPTVLFDTRSPDEAIPEISPLTHIHGGVGANTIQIAAESERLKIETELDLRTLLYKARQGAADADRLETEAKIAELKVLEARQDLTESLKKIGAMLAQDRHGNMVILQVPRNYDWDKLKSRLMTTEDLALESGPETPKNDAMAPHGQTASLSRTKS
jgi:hypothetical protein